MSTKLKFQPFELIPSEKPVKVVPNSIEELLFLGRDNIQQMIRLHRKGEKRLRDILTDESFKTDGDVSEMLRVVRSKIAKLVSLKSKTVKKPVLPIWRPMEYFCEEDNSEVVCFVGAWPDPSTHKVTQSDWVTGHILGAPSFIGTRYSVRSDEQLHDNLGFLDGHGCTFFVVEPRLMHRWEFEYLLANKDYLSIWAQNTEDYAPTPGGMWGQLAHNFASLMMKS